MTRLLTSLLTLVACSWSDHACASLTIWATHGMDRVKRSDAPRPLLEPRIYAAKGEWEPLQVIARGSAIDLTGMQIAASPLRSESGGIIPPPVVLREHYVVVSQPSELSPYPASEYPDALVPLSFPEQDIRRTTTVNAPYWIDVYVPPGTPAGEYRGSVTMTTARGESVRQAYTVQVWDFDLPECPALQSSIFIVWRRIAEIHGFDREANEASPPLQRILDDYYDMLVDHRLSPHEVWATYPNGAEPTGEQSFEDITAGLKHHLVQRHAGVIGLPLWETWPFADPLGADRHATLEYVAKYHGVCQQLGCADRLYKIFGELDEPHTPEAWEKVKLWYEFFQEARTKYQAPVPLLITAQPMDGGAAVANVLGHADILTPHVSALWMDVDGTNAPHLTQQHLASGGRLWTYSALVQAPEEWMVAKGLPKTLTHGHPPVLLTDFPAINHRMLAWLAPRYGVTGFTYWDTSHWPANFDPWQNAGTYPHSNNEVYNGDGFFIYPAHQRTHGYEGPVASIRLKWLRECVDDYDYISLMKAAGQEAAALERAAVFARSLGDWDDNIEALYAAREDLGRRLQRLTLDAIDSKP